MILEKQREERGYLQGFAEVCEMAEMAVASPASVYFLTSTGRQQGA